MQNFSEFASCCKMGILITYIEQKFKEYFSIFLPGYHTYCVCNTEITTENNAHVCSCTERETTVNVILKMLWRGEGWQMLGIIQAVYIRAN